MSGNHLNWTALDIGSGVGRECIFLAMRGWDVYGLDYLEKQISRAEKFAVDYDVSERSEYIGSHDDIDMMIQTTDFVINNTC